MVLHLCWAKRLSLTCRHTVWEWQIIEESVCRSHSEAQSGNLIDLVKFNRLVKFWDESKGTNFLQLHTPDLNSGLQQGVGLLEPPASRTPHAGGSKRPFQSFTWVALANKAHQQQMDYECRRWQSDTYLHRVSAHLFDESSFLSSYLKRRAQGK